MSAKLLDEPPRVFMPTVAKSLGLNEAIVVQQLHWVLGRDSAEVHDDRRWVRADLKFWASQFPWWSEKTIGRIFDNLEASRLVETRRTKNAKLYTLLHENMPWTGQSVGSETDTLSSGNGQIVRSPCKREEGDKQQREELPAAEDGDQLFATGVAPSVQKAAVSGMVERDARTVWSTYVQNFETRLRVKELTPPRMRTIVKALKAAGWTESPDDAGARARATAVELCQRAIVGLKSYRADHPDGSQDVNISVIFETGPHSKSNLTDQVQWWAEQAKANAPGSSSVTRIPLDLSGVPSVSKGTIQARRREVGQMFDHPDSPSAQERGQAAVDWLREHIGHEPKVEDGMFRGWQLVPDFTPPSRSNATGGDQ